MIDIPGDPTTPDAKGRTRPNSWKGAPQFVRGALVVYAGSPIPTTPTNVIVFQYNPETLTRSLQQQGTEYDWRTNAGDTEHVSLPFESFTLTIELDLADQLEWSLDSPMRYGLLPSLLALELLVYPSSQALSHELDLERQSSAKVAPGSIPMVLLVWGPNRVVPVRITSLSVTEQAFDINLNPIQARVDLNLRSLTARELHVAGKPWNRLTVGQLQQKEKLALQDLNSDASLRAQRIAQSAQPPAGGA